MRCHLTENYSVDADPRQSEPSQKPEHCEHNVRVCKRAAEAEHDGQDVRGQESLSPPVPVDKDRK